jgi:hypothetical protein
MSWKVGDWCFCDYKLQQIEEIKDGRICAVSDGYFFHGAYDLNGRVFPLDKRAKVISEYFEKRYNSLHEMEGNRVLNFPDIHRWFEKKWIHAMCNRDDDEFVKAAYEELDSFVGEIVNQVREFSNSRLDGVKVFGR